MSLKKLAEIRADIAHTKDQIATLSSSALCPKDAAQCVESTLLMLRSQFDGARIGMAIARGLEVKAADFPAACYAQESEKVMVLLATLFPDAVRDLLMAESRHYIDEKADTKAVRADKIMALEKHLMALERQEEALFCQLEASGMVVSRREDFDPAVVLTMGA